MGAKTLVRCEVAHQVLLYIFLIWQVEVKVLVALARRRVAF
jgi:hypothetical protein